MTIKHTITDKTDPRDKLYEIFNAILHTYGEDSATFDSMSKLLEHLEDDFYEDLLVHFTNVLFAVKDLPK